jgi:hypothetical protein
MRSDTQKKPTQSLHKPKDFDGKRESFDKIQKQMLPFIETQRMDNMDQIFDADVFEKFNP